MDCYCSLGIDRGAGGVGVQVAEGSLDELPRVAIQAGG